MPTRIGPYRCYFFSNEANEPPHIHIQRERRFAKFWLEPVALARATGFDARELRRIEGVVQDNRDAFVESWSAFFGR